MKEFVILHQILNQKNFAFKFRLSVVIQTSSLPFFSYLSTDYEFVIYCQIKQVVLNNTGKSKEYIIGCFKSELINKGCVPLG